MMKSVPVDKTKKGHTVRKKRPTEDGAKFDKPLKTLRLLQRIDAKLQVVAFHKEKLQEKGQAPKSCAAQ